MRRVSVGFVAALSLAFAAPASAGTLDQSQTDTSGGGFTVSERFTPGQTFTAGLTGLLDQVNLWVTRIDDPGCAPPGDLAVEIRTVTPGGVPTSTVLAATGIGRSAVPIDQGISPTPTPPVAALFASPAAVSVDTLYAIVVSETGSGSGCYRWYSSTVDVYPRGIGFIGDTEVPPPFEVHDPPTDLAFQTYVLVAGTCKGKTATLTGTEGNDELRGTPERDVIAGLGGKDEISGLVGKDLICGGKGKDTLRGGKGKDKLYGQGGKDTLAGGGGKDRCVGGKKDDTAKKCEVEKSI